jgi:hypothetical protein
MECALAIGHDLYRYYSTYVLFLPGVLERIRDRYLSLFHPHPFPSTNSWERGKSDQKKAFNNSQKTCKAHAEAGKVTHAEGRNFWWGILGGGVLIGVDVLLRVLKVI